LDPLIFSAIVISLLSVVSAAQTSGTCECDQQCPKTRELVTTIWGGVVTILVLSFDFCSAIKPEVTEAGSSTSEKVKIWCVLLIVPILSPVLMLSAIIRSAACSYDTRRRMPGLTVKSFLSPWTKVPAKIVYGCPVVITVPAVISIPLNFIDTRLAGPTTPNLSGAVVIGLGPKEAQDTKNVFLGEKGVEVLLQTENVLPPYDQLRVLQGSSGLATIISAVQSVGYICGVVVRSVQGLPVSPIEVVALTLSIQIFIKALLHNFVSLCHRPLHLHLTHDQAQTFADRCENYTADADHKSWVMGPFVVIVVLVSGVVIYYIIHMWHTTRRIMVVPIMLALVGLYLQLYPAWLTISEGHQSETMLDCAFRMVFLMFISALVHAMSYILSLVVTIRYWKADRLDAKTSSILAHIFPYIG